MNAPQEPDSPDSEVVEALLRGNKIEAIKIYRARHPSAELVDAKREVERIEGTLPRSPAASKGCARSAAVVLALVAALTAVGACR